MNFAWIYVEGPSFFYKTGLFNELEYSIKTVQKFYKGARCVVFGDKPNFNVEHVPVERVHVSPGETDVRHLDVIRKLEVISEYYEDFVLMYDDIFFLRKITQKDLKTYYCLTEIDDLSTYSRKGGLLYTRLWRNTYKKVAEIMPNIVDWETHLPRYMNSERVKWLINTYRLHEKNLLITSLYPAIYAEKWVNLAENDTIRSHIDQIGPDTDLDKVFSRKFLIIDDHACTSEMTNRIKALVQ